MFKIAFDEKAGTMHLTLWGFWEMKTMEAFVGELFAVATEINRSGRSFDVLNDSREFAVQSNEITQALTEVVKAGAEMNGGLSAVVVGGMLAKIQAERLFQHPNVRYFLKMEDARAWLRQKSA